MSAHRFSTCLDGEPTGDTYLAPSDGPDARGYARWADCRDCQDDGWTRRYLPAVALGRGLHGVGIAADLPCPTCRAAAYEAAVSALSHADATSATTL